METNLRKILLLFFLIFFSYIQADLVNIYRTMGIKEVQKELEKQLQTQEYWQKYIQNMDVNYGYYESRKFVLVANKASKKIEVFKRDNKKLLKLLTQDMIVGEKKGDKYKEGDLKTPVGAYRLTQKLTKLDQFYGPLALVTNYPNAFDKSLNKNGHGIWIHGMPLDEKREEFTQGCIALDNEKLLSLDEKINHDESILLINEDKLKIASKEEISKVLAFIYSWADSWRRTDFNEYISYYDKDFKRANGQNYKRFRSYKKRIFSRNEKKTIKFSNIDIMPYPNSIGENMYKIVMDEYYRTKSYFFQGEKELYVKLENNKVLILSED